MRSLLITKEQLIEYINLYGNIYKIAIECNCSKNTIKNYLKRYNIPTPKGFYSQNKNIGRPKGIPCTQRQKDLMSKKFIGANNPYYGKKHSDVIKKKMRDNHADFTGDKNPFKIACISDSSLIEKCINNKELEWSNLSETQKYNRTKKILVGDLSVGYWGRLNRNAKRRGILVDITPDLIWNLFLKQNKKCALSGVDLNLKSCYEITASLDRIDSKLGYIENNIQWVHKEINWYKSNMNQDVFIEWCNKVAKCHPLHHN